MTKLKNLFRRHALRNPASFADASNELVNEALFEILRVPERHRFALKIKLPLGVSQVALLVIGELPAGVAASNERVAVRSLDDLGRVIVAPDGQEDVALAVAIRGATRL